MPNRAEAIASYESQIGELQREIDVMQRQRSELPPGIDDDKFAVDNKISNNRDEIARLEQVLASINGPPTDYAAF